MKPIFRHILSPLTRNATVAACADQPQVCSPVETWVRIYHANPGLAQFGITLDTFLTQPQDILWAWLEHCAAYRELTAAQSSSGRRSHLVRSQHPHHHDGRHHA